MLLNTDTSTDAQLPVNAQNKTFSLLCASAYHRLLVSFTKLIKFPLFPRGGHLMWWDDLHRLRAVTCGVCFLLILYYVILGNIVILYC